MIKINGNDYRLVLLDTNALSEFSKHDESLRRFISWSMGPVKFVPCFSQFSLLEVRHRPDVYELVKRAFGILPCLMVKSHEQLLADEVDRYPDPSDIDPTLLGFSMVGGEGMDIDRVLEVAFGDEYIRGREKYWNDGRKGIVEGIASLVPNYPPAGDTYTPSEARYFIEHTSFSQIAMRQANFATQAVSVAKQMVDIDAFPSVKATAFAVWHKFYADRNRRPTQSDAYDIIIASAIPYMDAVITESHLAESLRKTQRLDDFIKDVEIYTLRDFRT